MLEKVEVSGWEFEYDEAAALKPKSSRTNCCSVCEVN